MISKFCLQKVACDGLVMLVAWMMLGLRKMILFNELEYGLRSVGRPKLRFKDNCKQILKQIGLLDWNVVALDRSLWRSKIQSVFKS